jgi:hypothetical protein
MFTALYEIESLYVNQVRVCLLMPYQSSGNWSLVSHRGGLGSIPGHSMRDFRWTQWHWVKFFTEYFVATLSVSFYHCYILSFTYTLLLTEGQTGEDLEPFKTH